MSFNFPCFHSKDLIEKFEKELKGDFEEVVISSFRDRAQINAAALEKAMKGAGTDENMLIEVICTASCNKINAIKMAYEESTLMIILFKLCVAAK